ncbi:MAG: sigma-54-dependent Fis family transcriptional regulator, partial [Deltaproteobacteria bacterium]
LCHVVASGFTATRLEGCTPVDPTKLAAALADLDPNLPDPGAHARALPVVKGSRPRIVRALLRTAAREVARHEEDRRARLAQTESETPGLWGIVGRSPQMMGFFEQLRRVANSDATVLIEGESGTGKELVARALFEHGRRAREAHIAQSCAVMSDELLESALFGHVRGAFSGATRSNDGLFGAAEGGTLFLDEVGEMSPALQVKLLRVLQDGSYMPVGATSAKKANVRVITATHRSLTDMVDRGEFRQDLFYRLHVVPLRLPPLRERPGDVRLLVAHFLRDAEHLPRRVSDAAWACLERYPFPGNVRELQAEVQRWELTAAGAEEIGPEHLSDAVRRAGGYGDAAGAGAEQAAAAAAGSGSLKDAVEELERALIRRGLERTAGNRTQLAKELDISRTTLNQRLKRYDLD